MNRLRFNEKKWVYDKINQQWCYINHVCSIDSNMMKLLSIIEIKKNLIVSKMNVKKIVNARQNFLLNQIVHAIVRFHRNIRLKWQFIIQQFNIFWFLIINLRFNRKQYIDSINSQNICFTHYKKNISHFFFFLYSKRNEKSKKQNWKKSKTS